MLRRFSILNAALQGTDEEIEKKRAVVLAHCKHNIVDWFNDWVWTFDPRNVALNQPAHVPFDLFPKQGEFLLWLEEMVAGRQEAIAEKSRDVGFTYLCGGFALHRWLFYDGFKTTFGSRVQDDVDRIGNPDTIFEKIRMMLYRLPYWMQPAGFSRSEHDMFMRLINPANGNIISGEGGDHMGRGGRSTMYVVDEAAFIERAERVDAAIHAVADCRIWVSSVNGMGNVFARKRHSGHFPVFTFHWSDDPRKTKEWAKEKKTKTDPHVWASEYDIDYAASVEGVCIQAKWVKASQKLRKIIEYEPTGEKIAGLDVGAGKAESALIKRQGILVDLIDAWTDPDSIDTAHKALRAAGEHGIERLAYDSTTPSAGVTSIFNRDESGLRIVPVNAGDRPSNRVWPDGKTSEDKFANRKAELWWIVRAALQKTYEYSLWLDGDEEGHEWPIEELLLLPDDNKLAVQLSMPKVTSNERGKILMESKEKMARRGIGSIDRADALMLTEGLPAPVNFKPSDYAVGEPLLASVGPN